MLKTECPNCKDWVYSPLLSELTETECPDCGFHFPVSEVYVSAGPYSMYRDILLKNVHKYMKLLREAKTEMAEIEQRGGQDRGYRESAMSLNIFIKSLEELLNGCRDRLRVPGVDSYVEYRIDNTPRIGKLVNISTTGLCLDAGENVSQLKKGRAMTITIKGGSLPEPLSLTGEVVWSGAENRAGVKFAEMDEETTKYMRKYVLEMHSRK